MNKKTLTLSLVAFSLFALVGISSASAYGWGWMGKGNNFDPEARAQMEEQRFSRQAEILGISEDAVKGYWAEGKTMPEIAQELEFDMDGFREKMHQQRQEEMRQRMQELVERGVITQEQADKRIENMGNMKFIG